MTNHLELLSYFNLTELPFTKEIPVEQLHLLPSVERNLAAAQLLVDTRGIGAITGKPGTGKSCLLRLLQHRLPAGLYRTFYVCHSSSTCRSCSACSPTIAAPPCSATSRSTS